MIPTHIKSISNAIRIGVITGTIINIISIKSMKNPATNTTIKIEIKNISGVRLDAVIISTKILSPSKPLKTRENDVAPSNIVNTIESEYQQNIDRHSQELIVTNLKLLLDYSKRYYDRQFYTRTSINKDLVSRFENLLTNYYSSNKQLELGIPTVRYCGIELGLSPNYLSDLLKKETGRNAIDHIHLFIIEKAKTELLKTTESISQIAYNLGFEHAPYFSRLFKKKTGLSPKEYILNSAN